MKKNKTILAITFLGLLALATPRPAAAGVSVFFGLPGVGLFAGPPVVVAPPPVVVGPSYYGPAYYGGPYWGHPGRHLGWYKHGWHSDRHHEGDWDDD
jgi:hypothetical protein